MCYVVDLILISHSWQPGEWQQALRRVDNLEKADVIASGDVCPNYVVSHCLGYGATSTNTTCTDVSFHFLQLHA